MREFIVGVLVVGSMWAWLALVPVKVTAILFIGAAAVAVLHVIGRLVFYLWEDWKEFHGR